MNQKILTASLAALVLTTGAFSVQAESAPPNFYSLNEVVVTASRTPEKKIDANADVAVVTADEIAQKHYSDVSQAVSTVPGVFLSNHGGNAQVYQTNSIYINGSSNVVVLVDGVRRNINGITGTAANLGEMINMDSIDHIEVLKGSASTLYGSDAQGGVINVITKKPAENAVHTTLKTSFGNNSTENYSFYNEGKEGKVFWTAEAGKELMGDYKDGWGRKVINHFNSEHYKVKLGYDLGNNSDISLNYEKYKSDYARPDSGSNDTKRDKGKKDNDYINLQYKAQINDRLSNQFSVYRTKIDFQDNYNQSGTGKGTSWTMGMKTVGVSDQLTYTTNKQTITGGFDWYKDEITKYHNLPFYNASTEQVPDGIHISNTAFYLQDKIDLNEKWNVTPGIRFDHNSEFGSHTSPSLTLGYKQNENTNYYFSYKQFFVAPNLYQLYSADNGNPNLDPEEGYTFEWGVNHKFSDSLSSSFSIFRQHAKNQIAWVKTDPITFVGEYRNTGKTDSTGFNISLNKQFNEHWSTSLGYSYLHINRAKDNLNINLDGQLPESTLDIGVNYQSDKLTASLYGRGVMNRYGNKRYPEMRNYANYWVWNLAANYQIRPDITVFGRLNNIFDQFYTDVGTCKDPYSSSWYSAPGRNFEIGLQFQF